MDIPKEDGAKIFTEELDDRYSIYYNYMTVEKVKNLLDNKGFIINKCTVVDENANASSYASGLMVFQCECKN